MLDSWGYSSVGRAPALQAGGQEFESPYLHLIIQEALNYHQYLENYTLKKIEDIDCQKTIKDINFTDLKNLFFRTRTKKYGYFVIMHSSLKNRAGVLSLMHWNKRSSEQERRVDALALRAEERRDKLRKAAGRCK